MAATILTGNITTADPLPDEQVVDMRNEFAELDPDDSQFTTLLTKLGTRAAVREKISWLEDQLRPRLVQLSATAASAASGATSALTFSQAYLATDDILRNLNSGEMIHVSSVNGASAATADRAIGGKAGNSAATADQWLIVGSAYKQGASYGTSRIVKRVLGFMLSPLAA